MPGTLILPGTAKPHNLTLPSDAVMRPIESDLYNICQQVAELSPHLHVIEISSEKTNSHTYAIMEHCEDGWERLVFKVRSDELDGRVIKKLRRIMAVPFEQRFQEAAKEIDDWEREQEEKLQDDWYERLGRPMWTQLEHDGFIQRPVSYAKSGVAQNRRQRRALERLKRANA